MNTAIGDSVPMSSVAENTGVLDSETRGGPDRPWAILRLVLGLVILVAAFLKAYQLSTTPSLGEGLLNARWFNILVVEFELFFGIWLLFGLLPRLTWFATVGCFAIFMLVSLYKAVLGEVSCNCFGAMEVNPWITTVFDIVVIGCLLVFRPRKRALVVGTPKVNPWESHWLASTALTTFVLALMVTVQVYLFFGSFVGLDHFMTGSEIAFEIDRSFHSPDDNTVQIIVANKTAKQITLAGAQTDCKCGTIEGIPLSVSPRSQSHVLFAASEGVDRAEKSRQKQRIVFFVDGVGTKKAVVELPLFKFLARR